MKRTEHIQWSSWKELVAGAEKFVNNGRVFLDSHFRGNDTYVLVTKFVIPAKAGIHNENLKKYRHSEAEPRNPFREVHKYSEGIPHPPECSGKFGMAK